MKQVNWKKLLLPNLPYVFIALFCTKLGQAARLAPGEDFAGKILTSDFFPKNTFHFPAEPTKYPGKTTNLVFPGYG